MSARFVSASSQKLLNSAPAVTAYPFAVGFWVYPTQTATQQAFWSLADTATATNFFTLGQSPTQWEVSQTDDATPLSTVVGTVVANSWAFICGNFLSATLRRIFVLQPNGSVLNGTSVTSDTPTGIDAMSIGCRNINVPDRFFDGDIGEFWILNNDVQAGLTNTPFAAVLRQIAYNGPFSVPAIAKDIVEYRSLRSDVIGAESDEVYVGAGKPFQNWENSNGVTLGPHPSLRYQGVETQLIYPYALRPLWTPAAGGVDTSESRTGTSTGTATGTGRIAVQDQKRSTVSATATTDADIAVQDAKRSDITGTATVTGVSDFRNANWEKAGSSEGQATVLGRTAVQDEKRSSVSAGATVTGKIAVEDRKRSAVSGSASVTGVATSESANEIAVAGISSAQATVNARMAWQAEIMASVLAGATVTGVSDFTDDSAGGGERRTFNPFIASVGRMMGR